MTIYGSKEALVLPLIRQLARESAGADIDGDRMRERHARATWTGIAEPGDRVAGMLVRELGAVEALAAVYERWDVARITASVAERAGATSDAPVIEADVRAALDRWNPRIDSSVALAALTQATRWGVHLVVPGDSAWPAGVDDLGDHAPLALWVRGNLSTLATASTSMALVGARAATGYGEHVTMEASAGLVDRGYTIVSGAAYGIDGMAHRAALASSGQTIAVLAGGVDRFYPSGHEALLTRIVEKGAVISELPCGSSPTKWRFLQRNRIIAAVSRATVVLEAGWRSGSLNTAGHASALGRPLGAVPGPVTSAASTGCHRLIRDFDAVCVTTPDEMAELAPVNTLEMPSTGADAGERSSQTTRVIDALSSRSPRSTSSVAARAGLSLAQVQSVLGVLELEGHTREREQGWVVVPG